MKFNEEDAIKLSEVAELIKEINNDTQNFRRKCLESIEMPDVAIERPQSFTLSYVGGRYIVGIKPYCVFTLDENGKVKEYHQNENEADSDIAHQFLDKNYDTLNNILIHLQFNPPRYYVGYSDRKGYMSTDFREDDTVFRITDATIEFNQDSTNTMVKYKILEDRIIAEILGHKIEFNKSDNSYEEILSKITDTVISKEMLPDAIKTKLGMLIHSVKINNENVLKAIHQIEKNKNKDTRDRIYYSTKTVLPKKEGINNEGKGRR